MEKILTISGLPLITHCDIGLWFSYDKFFKQTYTVDVGTINSRYNIANVIYNRLFLYDYPELPKNVLAKIRGRDDPGVLCIMVCYLIFGERCLSHFSRSKSDPFWGETVKTINKTISISQILSE